MYPMTQDRPKDRCRHAGGCNEDPMPGGELCTMHAMMQLAASGQTKDPRSGFERRAVKFDLNKPPLHLVPLALIKGSARAYGFGEKKYAAFNYRNGDGLAFSRTARATLGHVLDWLHGEENDPESGLCHLDHAAAALGMLMDTLARVRAGHLPASCDDRWKEVETDTKRPDIKP